MYTMYVDNYQMVPSQHLSESPFLSNNGGSHLVSRKNSIAWPRYPRNWTCTNANYVMIHW